MSVKNREYYYDKVLGKYQEIYDITVDINEDSSPKEILNTINKRKEIFDSIEKETGLLKNKAEDGDIKDSRRYSEISGIVKKIKALDKTVKSIITGKMSEIKAELSASNNKQKAAVAYTSNSSL